MTPLPFRNILIVRNDRMGDLLMTLPALDALRCTFPDAKMTLLIDERWIPLLKGHPDLDEMLPWNEREGRNWRAILRWARSLKQKHFDCAFVMNPSRLFHVATFLAGIPTRVGYRRKWGFLLSHAIADTKATRSLHEIEYNLELVRLLGIQAGDLRLTLPVPKEAKLQAQDLLSGYGVLASSRPIALHPFTSNPKKSWPMDSFGRLCADLKARGENVLVIGESEGFLSHGGAVDLSGKVPLSLLPALLRNCKVLVSNDSGPVHVAAAVGTPTVVVAPKDHAPSISRWRPLGEEHRVLLSPAPEEVVRLLEECFPCGS